MIQQTLNQEELDAMVAAMENFDFGEELDIEILDEDFECIGDNELYDEYDGQPDEYTEWQDFWGGDEYYDHSENCLEDY
jgi:hypothetical protein